jgi:hypothetical protein
MYAFVLEFEAAINSKINIFHCDNAGKNFAFKSYMLKNSRHAIWELTPQQNGIVEYKFATLYNKIRSVLNAARLTTWLHIQLWAKAVENSRISQEIFNLYKIR